jgi:hypothetical protein
MALVRARQLQLLLTQIDRLPEAERVAVCAHIQPGDVLAIQSAAPLDWVPLKMSIDLAHAVTNGLGRERTRGFFREQFAVTLNNAVLGSLVGAVSRHLSSDPRPGLRWLPRGHDLLFRGVGRLVMSVSPTEPEAFASIVDLPPEIAADRIWLDRYAWSVASLRTLFQATLECEVVDSKPEERFARFRIWWTETRPPRRF